MIRVAELAKSFPRVRALDGVSFEAGPGEIFGLLGPNGAGKTTTIRLILGLVRPSAGTVLIDGIDVARDPCRARSRVGAVLEETGIYDRLTALENVRLFAELAGLPRAVIVERSQDLFRRLALGEVAGQRAAGFSKGMKQKVAVARALITDPSVLLLDEPTAGLDVLTKHTILDLVRSRRAAGRCILYSTHIMSEAEEICDRIAVINRGRICATGSPAELTARTGTATLEDAFVKLVGGTA